MIVNHSFNMRQTDAHIFHFLGDTDTKQRFLNSSCFKDHNGTNSVGQVTL